MLSTTDPDNFIMIIVNELSLYFMNILWDATYFLVGNGTEVVGNKEIHIEFIIGTMYVLKSSQDVEDDGGHWTSRKNYAR